MSEAETLGSVPEGSIIGERFRVGRLLGRGGMGEVYAARHTTTGKEVALKLIHATSGAGRDDVRRFMREARASTAIQHPNVIEVFDVFEDANGTPVMVMELLRGEPFSAYRERVGAMRLFEIAEILLPATQALLVAHEKGIVHRDLKPDNVFLAMTAAGRMTKILDFGIAKVLDPTKIGSETQGQQTHTGSILGTPHYMSYEQAMGDKHVDHRADIWAMGVMIFEAITGRRPLAFETLGQMYASFLQGTVPSIREFLPELPDDVAGVLDLCLAKKQEDRLPDLRPLIAVLTKYADAGVPGATVGGRVLSSAVKSAGAVAATSPPLSTSVARSAMRGRSRVVLAVAAAVLAGGGALAFVALRRPPDAFERGGPPPPVSTPLVPASSAPMEVPPLAPSSVVESPALLQDAGPAKDAAPSSHPPRPIAPRPIAAPPQASAPAPSASPNPKRVISDKLPY